MCSCWVSIASGSCDCCENSEVDLCESKGSVDGNGSNGDRSFCE